MDTEMYFGDGVYGKFDGHQIVLSANDRANVASIIIYLEPGMLDLMRDWRDAGYVDYNSGKPYGEHA